MPKAKSTSIVLLRFFACLLIINSHCREIYPWYFLAVGGGHGNSLFFILSGYCLANIKLNFPDWYIKRIRRIVPASLLVVVFGIVIHVRNGLIHNLKSGFYFIIDQYWFVWAIMIYYCVYYIIMKDGNRKKSCIAMSVYFLGYALLFVFCVDKTQFSVELAGISWFKVYFYFGIMLAGGILNQVLQLRTQIALLVKKHYFLLFFLILLSGFTWITEYWLVMMKQTAYLFQFIIQLSVFVFAISMFMLCMQCEKIDANTFIFRNVISPISESTLEIYLVQVTFISIVESLPFPANWCAFLIISIGGGLVVHHFISLLLPAKEDKYGKKITDSQR